MGYESATNIGFQFADGQENPSGLQELAYLIRVSDIQTEGKPGAVTDAASIVTISTAHTLKTGKAPIEVQPLFGKSGLLTKLSGEELSKVFESDVELMIPQISAAVLGSAVAIKNTRFILLVRRPGQNTGFWQIGCKAMPAKVQDIAGGFGAGATAEVGLKITLKAFDTVPMYAYTGELPAVGD